MTVTDRFCLPNGTLTDPHPTVLQQTNIYEYTQSKKDRFKSKL